MFHATALFVLFTFAQTTATPRTGAWRAWLDSPGGELPFGLELQKEGSAWKAWLINGEDRAEVPRVEISGDEIVLSIPHYASTIRAKITEGGAKLDGEWLKRGRSGKVVKLPFHAAAGAAPRFKSSGLASIDAAKRWSGRWLVRFASTPDDAPVMALRAEPDGVTTGTILSPSGDYGFMAGVFSYFEKKGEPPAGSLKLSAFDGSHAFLIVGGLEPDGTLKGDFWSGDTFHDTWTAKRDDTAALPDGFSQTQFSEGVRLADLKFLDLEGKTRSLVDPAFAGKAIILEVFGSWCPNCSDSSRYLVELHREYKARGLSIVGLAFESTGDYAVDVEQVRAFAKYHNIEYPLLLAGVADREKASAALPIIDKLRAYPTLILLDGEGKGRATYTGFSGPATGEEYIKFRKTFEAKIEDLLK